MSLPAHIAETVVTTSTYACLVCGARVTPGQYANPDYGDQLFNDWLARHAHDNAPRHAPPRDAPP